MSEHIVHFDFIPVVLSCEYTNTNSHNCRTLNHWKGNNFFYREGTTLSIEHRTLYYLCLLCVLMLFTRPCHVLNRNDEKIVKFFFVLFKRDFIFLYILWSEKNVSPFFTVERTSIDKNWIDDFDPWIYGMVWMDGINRYLSLKHSLFTVNYWPEIKHDELNNCGQNFHWKSFNLFTVQ